MCKSSKTTQWENLSDKKWEKNIIKFKSACIWKRKKMKTKKALKLQLLNCVTAMQNKWKECVKKGDKKRRKKIKAAQINIFTQ